MEAFNFEEAFKPALRLLVNTGIWPKQDQSIPYRIRGWLCIFLLTTLTCGLASDIIFDFKDISGSVYALCMGLAALHTIVKVSILTIGKNKLDQIFGFLKDPIFTSHGSLNIYLVRKMRSCAFGSQLFIMSSWLTVVAIVLTPVFGFSNRLLPTPFPVDMKDQPLYFYLLVWLIQGLGSILVGVVNPGYDCLIIFLLGTAAAQLKVLREGIVHSTDGLENKLALRDFDNIVNNRLRSCIIHHITIERYVEVLEDMFMYSFLMQVLFSLIVTVFVGFNIMIAPVTSPDFGRAILFFLAVVIELTIFCVPGNEIVLQSEKILDACYMSEWTNCGPSVRRTFFIIMERAKRPLKLTAAKFVVLSLDSLVSVLKLSFSYFTVLKQVLSKVSKR